MLPDVSAHKPADGGGEHAREEAIRAIERRRRFWAGTVISSMGMAIVVAIWAISQYHDAGGWPTQGFSLSSGQANMWNIWIIYPFIAWVLLTATGGFLAYRRRPIPEGDIRREIDRA